MLNLIRFVLSSAGQKSKEISFYDTYNAFLFLFCFLNLERPSSFTFAVRKGASGWINFSFCCPKVHVCVCIRVTASSPSFNHMRWRCVTLSKFSMFTIIYSRTPLTFFYTKHPFYSPVHLLGSADSFMNYKYLLGTLTWISLSINRTNLQTYPLCVFLCVSEVYNFVVLFLSVHESLSPRAGL